MLSLLNEMRRKYLAWSVMPKLKRNVGSNQGHFALAAEFEQGVLVRPRRDLYACRAGLAQRCGDLVRDAKVNRLCQPKFEQARIACSIEERLGGGAGEVQDCIELAIEGSRGRIGENARFRKTIDHHQIDLEIFAAQRAGEIAGAVLAGKVQKPCRRL